MGSSRKSRSILLVLVAAVAWPAFAEHPTTEAGDPHATAQSSAAATAASSASSEGGDGGSADASATGGSGGSAESSQTQTAEGGAGGDGGSASNLGNAQHVSLNSHQKRQAPSVFAPAVYASGPCAYGWSAGASIPGGGASFGKTKPDKNCDRRELARVMAPLNPDLALKVLCGDPIIVEMNYNGQLIAGDCDYMQPPVVTTRDLDQKPKASSSEPDPRYATKEDLDRVFKKSQSK